jgi:hypothetical protein
VTAPVHNSSASIAAKIELRERALAHVGEAHVVDLFCGPVGEMHRHVWSRAASYLGVDVVYRWPDRRARIVAPWRDALEHVPMARFNVFDLDAFGAPWPALLELTQWRRAKPGEKLAIVTTDGNWRSTMRGFAQAVESRAAFRKLGVEPPSEMGGEQRSACESALLGAAHAMGARVASMAVAGYGRHRSKRVGYAVALLVGVTTA